MQSIPNAINTGILKDNRGNALVILLILIALLAALTAVAMRSSSRSSGNMDIETSRIEAERLMRQAKSFETAVTQLITINRCGENQISFDNSETARDYTNPSAPATKTCDVFNLKGSGLAYSAPNSAALDASFSADADFGHWLFTSSYCVLGIGSDDDDACADNEVALMAIVPHINLATCLQINELNSITNPSDAPPTESLDETAATFVGTYTATADAEIGEGASGSNLANHPTGCLKNTSGSWANSYVFYSILLSR